LEHFDAIQNSPFQIYHSALPLCPYSSWLCECYGAELLQEVRVVEGLQTEWGTCSYTVSLEHHGLALSYRNNTIAVGSASNDIIILDGVTGSQAAVLSGHTGWANSLTFSSDGTSLVSGSNDKTIKLWDMQTGGVVKTFSGHTHWVLSVSISADHTMIASGSADNTNHLWDIQTGECQGFIQQQDWVNHVSFSPANPQHLFSASGGKVWQWNINGQQITPTYDGSCCAFSPDGTQFVLFNMGDVTVRNSESREIVAEFHMANRNLGYFCFSPDGRCIAVAAGIAAYIWDISSSDPHLVETFIGHSDHINSIAFSSPSSLISTSNDNSVKFWRIGGLPIDLVATDLKSTSLASAPIESVSLQARDGIAISSDSDGVVKTWDILTGLCRSSFQTPAKYYFNRDAQMIDSKVIFVWCDNEKIRIWDTENSELLLIVDAPECLGIRISGDGSKVFCLTREYIQAWSVWTGEPVGKVNLEMRNPYLDPLCVDGSRIWVRFMDAPTQGWDFGIPGSPPVPLSNVSAERPHLDFIGGTIYHTSAPSRIIDRVTGGEVFQLSGRYAEFCKVQWDGQYLITGYKSGQVLILDFSHLYPQ